MLEQRFGRPSRRPVYRPYARCFLSGVALVLCFPVFDIWPLAWVALAPALYSFWELPPRKAFVAGLYLGIPYFYGTQYWIYYSMHYYGGVPLAGSVATVVLLALYLSLYPAVFAFLFSRTAQSTSLPAVFLAPVFWVVLEFARSYAFSGFPWSSIGYTQYKFLHVIQFADITGVYGVSALVLAINGALADIFIARGRRKDMPLANLGPMAAGFLVLALVVAAVLGYGFFRLSQDRQETPVTASIVQGSVEQDMKWDPKYQADVLRTYKSLTAGAVTSRPDIVVWPETAVPFYWESDAEHTKNIRGFAEEIKTNLLFGAITVKGPQRLANSAVLLDAEGKTAHVYDKIHLVPFGEYVPLKWVLSFVNRLAVGIGDYESGKSYALAKTPKGEFGTLVCYEVIFPGLVRKFFRERGDFIVNITNDAWFGKTNGPYQHFAMAALRAVENRKPVIRAANSGVSGFFDSNGRVLSTLGLFERGVITEDISIDRTRTFYSRYGDLFSYLCIIITIILVADIRRR